MKQTDPHEERFRMAESYDKSTYLSKVRRVPMRDFASYTTKNTALSVEMGGDPGNEKRAHSKISEYYDTS